MALNLRLPSDLHAELKRAAAADDRSLNAQIVHLLRQALAERPGNPGRS